MFDSNHHFVDGRLYPGDHETAFAVDRNGASVLMELDKLHILGYQVNESYFWYCFSGGL